MPTARRPLKAAASRPRGPSDSLTTFKKPIAGYALLLRLSKERGWKTLTAPVRDEWIGGAAADAASFQLHPQYGFMCPLLKDGVDLP